MPQVDLSFAQDPNTLALAIIYGMVPALAWLFFWLREHAERPKKGGLLTALFFGGALMVVLALPVERFLATFSNNNQTLTILWAVVEEVLKFGLFAFVVLRNKKNIQAPVDYAVYIMVVALGFAGFENALYFLQPLQAGSTGILLLSGAMRFLGTTLMHATASGLIGIGLGFAYFKPQWRKIVYATIAVAAAGAFHSVFNLFIEQNNGGDALPIFGFLWLATIIVLGLFEHLRRMESSEFVSTAKLSDILGPETQFKSLLATAQVTDVDPTPLATSLEGRGFFPESKEYAQLRELIAKMRELYIHYLGSRGTDEAKVASITLAIIPDTVSPRAISGIFTVLKGLAAPKKR